jgi:hypothetical protein
MNGSDLSILAWAMLKEATRDVIIERIGADYPPVILRKGVLQIALMRFSD